MKLNRIENISFLLLLVLSGLLSSCSNTKFLAENEILYTGIKEVKLYPNGEVENEKQVKSSVYWSAYYKPNNSFYLPRRVLPPVRLWIYNYMGTDKEKGFKSWVHRNFSQTPILISELNLDQRTQKLESELFNEGYFDAKVDYDLVFRKNNPKKAMVRYKVLFSEAFTISKIDYVSHSQVFDSLIQAEEKLKLIEVDQSYKLVNFIDEQQRITGKIKDEGFFYFEKDYFEFSIDTSEGNKNLRVVGEVSNAIPERGRRVYTIRTISLFLKSGTNDSTYAAVLDSLYYDSLYFYYDELFVSPKVLAEAVYFRPNDKYNQQKNNYTRQHLGNYGLFKTINISYTISPTDSSQLDVQINLSPLDKISLSAEAKAVTKSNGFAGPAAEFAFTDENFLGGAEKFKISLKGGFEWQLRGNTEDYLGPNSYELGLNAEFQVPKLIAPFGFSNRTNVFVPQTVFSLGFELLNRVQYYKMNSYNGGFGYRFKNSRYNQHQLLLPDLNIVNLLDTTSAFSEIVNSNPSVRRSFEEQTILSLRYRYSYDNERKNSERNSIGWESAVAVAAPFAQFVKVSQDFSYRIKMIRHATVVSRLYVGIGYPFGDGYVMPYVEQFFSGGANSIRGFRARSLGPGSFLSDTLTYFDQTGDIKLEFNSEYRFRMGSRLYGAVFIDAGNIWLTEEDPQRPGSKFEFNRFYKELALGTGVGLRFDFDFFVVRLDLGIPLRNPGYPETRRWVFNNGDIWSANLFLAIGYPF